MATQFKDPHAQDYKGEPCTEGDHSGVEGEEGQDEKKSVLKKVKDKAKKIKHTLAKKTLGNGHDNEHAHAHPDDVPSPDAYGYEEEEDESEEDPEVHGAPMYESAAGHTLTDGEHIPDQSRVDVGSGDRTFEGGQQFPKDTTSLERDPHAPKDLTQHFDLDRQDRPPFEEDPHAPKDRPHSPANYQTKVADPTASGGHEAGVPSLDSSFQAMKLQGEDTGSHDQFSPELQQPSNSSEAAPTIPENPIPPPHPPANQSDKTAFSSYTQKITSATSSLAQKAVSAKNAVASTLGYGQNSNKSNSNENATTEQPTGATGYGRKIAEKLAPVYGKVAEAGSAVVAKISPRGGGGKSNESTGSESPESRVKVVETEGGVKRSDRGVSVKEFIAEKLQPGEEHKALSEMICDAFRKRKDEPESGSEEMKPTVVSVSSDSGGDGAGRGVVAESAKETVGLMLGMGGESRDLPNQRSESLTWYIH